MAPACWDNNESLLRFIVTVLPRPTHDLTHPFLSNQRNLHYHMYPSLRTEMDFKGACAAFDSSANIDQHVAFMAPAQEIVQHAAKAKGAGRQALGNGANQQQAAVVRGCYLQNSKGNK